jgi:peptide/nickel transport system substrate-binding protein
MHRWPQCAAILLLAGMVPACNVDRPKTPHEKDLAARREARRALRDAGVPGAKAGAKARPPEPKVARERQVVIAMAAEPRHLNPLLEISRWGHRIAMHNIFESLLRRDPQTHEPRPNLATEWTVSPDGRVYKLKLRRDVTWHDGKPFTSRDVWYTLRRMHDKLTPMGPFRDDLVNQFHQVDPLSTYSIRITLAFPNNYLLDHLCELPMMPYHLTGRSIPRGHRLNVRPVGTGPFRFSRWVRGKEIRLRKNGRYWGGVPEVGEVVFRLIPSPAKALTDLKRGLVDILPHVARIHYPEQITLWAKRRFQQVWSEPPGFQLILWNTRHKVLSDFRVRRALTMLIDRGRIIKEVYRGLARPVAGPFYRAAGLGDPKLQPWPFDPVRARNLLDNAGWRDRDGDKIRDLDDTPMRIVLLRPVTSDVMDDALRVMVAELKRSGVELEAVQTDWRRLTRLLRSGKFMAAALSFRGRPAEDLSELFHSTSKRNYGRFGSLAVDKLLAQMRNSLSRKRRAFYSAGLERALHAAQPVTFLHAPRVLTLVHRRLQNVQIGADWIRLDRIRVVPFKDPAKETGRQLSGWGLKPRKKP